MRCHALDKFWHELCSRCPVSQDDDDVLVLVLDLDRIVPPSTVEGLAIKMLRALHLGNKRPVKRTNGTDNSRGLVDKCLVCLSVEERAYSQRVLRAPLQVETHTVETAVGDDVVLLGDRVEIHEKLVATGVHGCPVGLEGETVRVEMARDVTRVGGYLLCHQVPPILFEFS